jgi:AcrR family transcriptional regulator
VTRKQRASETRRNLVEIARELAAERGFAGTSMTELQARSGLARGGIYHHFSGKGALLQAVAEDVESELLAWTAAANTLSSSAWVRLRSACLLYLSACTDPGVRRILLTDAPAVLGDDAPRVHRLERFQALLEDALEDDPGTAAALAPLLVGALDAAAQQLGDPEARETWEALHRSVTLLLEGLRLVQQQGVVPTLSARTEWEEDPWRAWKMRAVAMPRSSAT